MTKEFSSKLNYIRYLQNLYMASLKWVRTNNLEQINSERDDLFRTPLNTRHSFSHPYEISKFEHAVDLTTPVGQFILSFQTSPFYPNTYRIQLAVQVWYFTPDSTALSEFIIKISEVSNYIKGLEESWQIPK